MRIWSQLLPLVAVVIAGGTALCSDQPLALRSPDKVFLVAAESDLASPTLPASIDPADYLADDPQLTQVQTSFESLQTQIDNLHRNATLTTRDKDWHLTAFGALAGEIIFAEQRAVIPSAILFLSPSAGRDTPTIDVHGKQSSLGLELVGPEIFGMQSGGLVLTYFYGESLLEDQQGLFIPRGYAELKNEQWRFAAGALGDIINPRIPAGGMELLR